jgi:RHS repeat-associated protein
MYTRNDLNQYTHVYRYGDPQAALFPDYDEDGNLSALGVAGDMNCNGVVNTFDITPFTLALTDPAAYQQQYPDCDIMQADLNGDGLVNNFDIDFLMGAMGNVATRFEWDAENRLTAAYPASPWTGDKKVEFRYDYLNRRIQKKVFEWTGSGWSETPSLERRYVWAGHLLLMELDGNNQPVRKYTWGLDLAGQNGQVNSLEGAGGIGGLLAVYDLNDTPGGEQTGDDLQYVYAYDGNGNVLQVLDWSASSATNAIVAKYEYDPYGNVVAQAGDYAERNPIRFSTKQCDDETGFGYWEQRYYSPRLGRWISRDPLEEGEQEKQLYAYVQNDPMHSIDGLGLRTHSGEVCCEYNVSSTHYISDPGTSSRQAYKTSSVCRKTVRCGSAFNSPLKCCECCGKSHRAGLGWETRSSLRLARATWGPCCWCTITVRRESWIHGARTHHIAYLKCPHFQAYIDLHPSGYRHFDRLRDVRKELKEQPYTIASKQVPCEEADALRDQWTRSYGLNTLCPRSGDYDFWKGKHCRWFAFKTFHEADGAIQLCD